MQNNRLSWWQRQSGGAGKHLGRSSLLLPFVLFDVGSIIISLAKGAMTIPPGDIITILSSGTIQDAASQGDDW